MIVFVSKQDAIDSGFTHEATLYGVGVFVIYDNEDVLVACKFTPFAIYHFFCDLFADIALLFTPSDCVYELPLKNVRRINDGM